jgi:serine/threonine-protein kinase
VSPQRWREIEDLYTSASARPREERDSFLQQACPDPELRSEVLSLLANGDTPSAFVDRPAWEAQDASLLSPGSVLGPYEVVRHIATGGMGEVYEARDTRLLRTVAIKTGREKFSARFEREARAIGALNHPHICQIYDVGPNYLVMEYIAGQPVKGPVALERALRYAIEICDALSAAHNVGIVHRDLKPANVLLTKSGVKVLDFGLAKRESRVEAGEQSDAGITQQGTISGTLHYMAPEQLQGKEADARADIFSFGCLFYEMLTGKRAFDGADPASVIAAILERPSPSLSIGSSPPALERLLQKCLAKDRDKRWQSASDLGDELAWIAQSAPVVPSRRRSKVGSVLPWAIAGASVLALAMTGAGLWNATRPVDHPLIRFNVDLGPEAMPGLNLTATISPDGRRLVFPARGPDGRQQLATRLLDQPQLTFLPGTENGSDPFFSPDSQWIAFFVSQILKKISVLGGAPETVITGKTIPPGGSWGRDGNIVTSLAQMDTLYTVSSGGGIPRRITRPGAGLTNHRWPQVLPGGGAVLYTASSSANQMDDASIEVVSLKTGISRVLARGGYYGRYLPTGYLVYIRQGVLVGVKFDPEALEVRGTPVPLLEDMAANPVTGGGQFDFSNTGTLVYASGKSAAQEWQLSWLDSSGTIEPLMPTPGPFAVPRISPDGRKVAFIGKGGDLYVYDVERRTPTRLTFTGANFPVWSPDNLHLLFLSASGLTWIRSDGAGELQTVLKGDVWRPYSFTSDGRRLVYAEINQDTGMDLWTVALELTDPDHPKTGKPEAFLRTAADEMVARFSPNGRWIAYRSNATGSPEIYVRPFPAAGGGKWQISTGGGLYAAWSKNGRELFYETTENRIMVVDYSTDGASFLYGQPRLWSDKRLFGTGTLNMDLAPDGKRFVVFSLPEAAPGAKETVHVTVLINFFDWLRKRLP